MREEETLGVQNYAKELSTQGKRLAETVERAAFLESRSVASHSEFLDGVAGRACANHNGDGVGAIGGW